MTATTRPLDEPVTLTVTLSTAQIRQIAESVAQLLTEREPETDRLLSAAEAAEFLRCPRGRVYDLVQLGKLEPRRDGRRLLFQRSDLIAYLGVAR